MKRIAIAVNLVFRLLLISAVFVPLTALAAPGSPLPEVATSPATLVSASGAVLNGNLNGLGQSDNVGLFFDYGITNNYFASVPAIPAAMTGPGSFSANLSGLAPATAYHFRGRAVGTGTAYGADLVFVTSALSIAAAPASREYYVDVSQKCDPSGVFYVDTYASSSDGLATLSIGAGVTGLTSAGAKLTRISIAPAAQRPDLPPEWACLLAYQLEPSGTIFDRPVRIAFNYAGARISSEIDSTRMFIAWWDPTGSEWVDLGGEINSANGLIGAQMRHFSLFALFAPFKISPQVESGSPGNGAGPPVSAVGASPAAAAGPPAPPAERGLPVSTPDNSSVTPSTAAPEPPSATPAASASSNSRPSSGNSGLVLAVAGGLTAVTALNWLFLNRRRSRRQSG